MLVTARDGADGQFFDVNLMFMFAQCAKYPLHPISSSELWTFLAAAYGACWAVSVIVVWLGWEVGFQFWRRWRHSRPTVEPIYLSLYANLHLSLASFSHFCFLLHIRLSAWRTTHAIDLIPETCHFVVQLLPGLVPLVARAGIACVLLISHWGRHPSIDVGTSHRDPNYFLADDPSRLTPYAKGVVLAFCSWVALRLVIVITAGIILLLLLASPLSGAKTSTSMESLLTNEKRRMARDPASSHFPAKSWRDENELQWAWRERTRARIQDAFELCMIRPTRSQVTLEKLPMPPPDLPPRVHHPGESLPPKVLPLDFASLRRGDSLRKSQPPAEPSRNTSPQPSRARAVRKSKQSTAPDAYTLEDAILDSGILDDSAFYGDIVELGALYGGDLSSSALHREVVVKDGQDGQDGLRRLSEESEEARSPWRRKGNGDEVQTRVSSPAPSELADAVPAASLSLTSLPIISPITPTFDTSKPSPHPLDAAAGSEQTFTASKGPVQFEVYHGPVRTSLSGNSHDRSLSFSSAIHSRMSVSSSNRGNTSFGAHTYATFGTFGDSGTDPLAGVSMDDSFEVLSDTWSKNMIDEETSEFQAMFPGVHHAPAEDDHESTISEEPRAAFPRGSAFFGHSPSYAEKAKVEGDGEAQSRSSTPNRTQRASSRSPSPAFALDTSMPLSQAGSPSPHSAQVSTSQPPVAPVAGSPPDPKAKSPPPRYKTPRPRRKASTPHDPSTASSPQDSSGHETINEAELFYHAPSSPSPRPRKISVAAVGLRPAMPAAPVFGAVGPDGGSPTRDRTESVTVLGPGLLPSPMGLEEFGARDPDLDPTPPATWSETTIKAARSRPLARVSSDGGSEVPARVESEHTPTPKRPSSSPTHPPNHTGSSTRESPAPAPPAEPTPPAAPLEERPPAQSLRQRRIPSNLRVPPSAFPPPPPEPQDDTDIPPPLPSSFSRGYRSRMERAPLPQWRNTSL